MARSCYILTDYDCGQRLSLEKGAVREHRARERGEWSCHTEQWSTTPGQGLRIKCTTVVATFYSGASLAGPSTPYTVTATPTQPHADPPASFPKRAVTSQDANLLCGELEASPVSPPNWAGLARALYTVNL